MSFDTRWDVDKYKSGFESEEHWRMRRNFMLAHKTAFPEERLVCLAQVFFNVEFLGCRYPEKTMKLIEELSKDIAAEHRENQKNKLQRTFVGASDAAEARIKGVKRPGDSDSKESDKKDVSTGTGFKKITFVKDRLGNTFETSSSFRNPESAISCGQTGGSKGLYNSFTTESKTITMEEIKRCYGPFGNVVLFYQDGEHPNNILQRFAKQWDLFYDCKIVNEGTVWIAKISLNNILLGESAEPIKSSASRKAFTNAVNKIMESYFTVKIKYKFKSDTVVTTSDNKTSGNKSATDTNRSDIDKPLEEDNIGNKLLKMMGWSGGGLGKNQQGIVEPVKATTTHNRAGFGNVNASNDSEIKRVKQIIINYKNSENTFDDLVFSSEFSKEQRKIFHEFAQRHKLKSKSYGGKGDKRHLVVSKVIPIWTIIEGLVDNCGQLYDKYELLRPGEKLKDCDDPLT